MDQNNDRKMECARGVDPVWYQSMMRAQRLRERQEDYRSERDQQFQQKSISEITEMLTESGEISDSTSDKEQIKEGKNKLSKKLWKRQKAKKKAFYRLS